MSFQPFAFDWQRAQISVGPEQWNWLAVEIVEIRRYAAVGDQAHDRLALLLTDHLVEVIMKREIDVQLAFQLSDSLVEKMRESRRGGDQLGERLEAAVNDHVGPERRKDIDANWADKTGYLCKKKVLSEKEQQVLNRLHEYRNAAYHRDILDPTLIGDLVLAYMALACDLLARHRPVAFVMAMSEPGEVTTPCELPGLLADGLETDIKAMARRFSDHSVQRVHTIATAISVAQTLVRDNPMPAGDPFADLLTELSGAAPQVRSWTNRADGLGGKSSSLVDLMVPFINLDRVLSAVEPSVRRFNAILDVEEQRQIDDLRGK